MSAWRRLSGPALVLAVLGGAVLAIAQEGRRTTFPHQEHAGLFPFCTGCHEGIPEGNAAAFYPEPGFCAQCHDGASEERVEWAGPVREVTNLAFSHPEHAQEVQAEGDRALACRSCHVPAGGGRMQVRLAEAQQCLACHGHPAREHLADAQCTTCHVPLAETRFTLARIEGLPAPDDHARPDFLLEVHGGMAAARPERCATCHVREQCAGCHVNAPAEGGGAVALLARLVSRTQDTIPSAPAVIRRIPAAAGRLELPAWEARYPLPPSHQQPDFIREHGDGATAASCSTCHTRESCLACHLPPAPELVDALPSRSRAPAPGVATAARYPEPASHREPGFLERHGARASVESCATCHTRESCETCHAPPVPRVVTRFPRAGEAMAPGVTTTLRAPPSHASAFFASRHGSYAASRPESCATCHEASSFCQSCHQPVAMAEWARPGRGGGAASARAPLPLTALAVPHDTQRVRPAAGAAATGRSRGGRAARPADFHPPNYAVTHPAEAYGRRLECASCHDTRTFCRDCHEQMGFGTVGRLGQGFHDAQPLWLLRHGQAARQALESCATCHAQRDCMQCHSETGSFQVSPHGPGFDARRAAERNDQVCRACHLGNPLQGRSP